MRKLILISFAAMLLASPSYPMDYEHSGASQAPQPRRSKHDLPPLSEFLHVLDTHAPKTHPKEIQRRTLEKIYNTCNGIEFRKAVHEAGIRGMLYGPYSEGTLLSAQAAAILGHLDGTPALLKNHLTAEEIIRKCNASNPRCPLWGGQGKGLRRAYGRYLTHQNRDTFLTELSQIQSRKGKGKLLDIHIKSIMSIVDQANTPNNLPFPELMEKPSRSSSPKDSSTQSSASSTSGTNSADDESEEEMDEQYVQHLVGEELLNDLEEGIEQDFEGMEQNFLVNGFLRKILE